jgi:hypothetical protein
VKLPTNLRAKGSTFLEIATEAENWYISHGKRDIRTVKIRMKRLIKEFGSQPADQISPAHRPVDFQAGLESCDLQSLQGASVENFQARFGRG